MSIKEKWSDVKAKACETKRKIKNWYAENREIVNAMGLMFGTYGGIFILAKLAGDKAKEHEAFTTGFNINETTKNFGMTESMESLNENWKAVNLFAKSLRLQPGEVYIIEGKDGTLTDMVTSHLIDINKINDAIVTDF